MTQRELDLYRALQQIVIAWESIPENVQVPDEINIDNLWSLAKRALERYRKDYERDTE